MDRVQARICGCKWVLNLCFKIAIKRAFYLYDMAEGRAIDLIDKAYDDYRFIPSLEDVAIRGMHLGNSFWELIDRVHWRSRWPGPWQNQFQGQFCLPKFFRAPRYGDISTISTVSISLVG